MSAEYVLHKGSSFSGEATYAFVHNDRLFFKHQTFHSELHAKREAVEWLATVGINVETDDITVSQLTS